MLWLRSFGGGLHKSLELDTSQAVGSIPIRSLLNFFRFFFNFFCHLFSVSDNGYLKHAVCALYAYGIFSLVAVCYRPVSSAGGYQCAVVMSCRSTDDVSTHLLAIGRSQSINDAGYLSPQPRAAASSQPLSHRNDSVSATSESNLWGSSESEDNVFEV